MKLPFFGNKENDDAPAQSKTAPSNVTVPKPILGQTQKLPSIATGKPALGALGQTQKVSAAGLKKRGAKEKEDASLLTTGQKKSGVSMADKLATAMRSRPTPTESSTTPHIEASVKHVKTTGVVFCPVCETRMEAMSYGDTIFYHCDQCQGYWCPGNAFTILSKHCPADYNRLLAIKLQILFQSRLEAELDILTNHNCPKCKHALSLRHYKKVVGVAMETCKQQCGTFVSKMMLEKIQVLTKMMPDVSAKT